MYFIWSMFLLPYFLIAQINLVQNPSFEILTACPNNQDNINYALGWDSLKNGGGGTPDLYNICNLSINGVPNNYNGYQFPKTGNSYSGIICYYNQFGTIREYLQNKLNSKLIQNKTYCVKFFINLSEYSNNAIDRIGLLLDNGNVHASFYNIVNNSVPQIQSQANIFISDTINWQSVFSLYTASGDEEYLTIGNFNSDSLTNLFPIRSTVPLLSYYYIDDVSIIPLDTKAYAGKDTSICLGDSVFIGRVPEVGLECQWYSNNLPIHQGAGFWAKPSANMQYVVAQDVCGIISYDTVKVMLKDTLCKTEEPMPPNINNNLPAIPNIFTPNQDGVNDVWQFKLGIGNTLKSLHIYNRWGNLVAEILEATKLTGVRWDGYTTAGEPCSEGVYYYTLEVNTPDKGIVKLNGYVSLVR